MPATIIWTRSKHAWLRDQKLFAGQVAVQHIPTIEIEFEKIDISSLIAQNFDGVIFTSVTAVKAVEIQPKVKELIQECGKAITFGKQTQTALTSLGYDVDFHPQAQTGEELCTELDKTHVGKKFLFVGAKYPATDFAEVLTKNTVALLPVYQTKVLSVSAETQNEVIAAGSVICLASPSAARAFTRTPAKIIDLRCVCIGPTTAAAAKEVFSEVHLADAPNILKLFEKAEKLVAENI